MDISGFMRRFSQSSGDTATSPHRLPSKPQQGLTVDTMKESQPQWVGSSPINIAANNNNNQTSESPPGSGRTSASATPTSTRSSVSDISRDHPMMRRRRSNSECLMLAKNRGGQDLPGPCKEYIAGVKQILARSEEAQPTLLRRRSSMSLKGSPPMANK